MRKVYKKPETKSVNLIQKHHLCQASVTTEREIEGPGGGTIGEVGGGMARELNFDDKHWFDEE